MRIAVLDIGGTYIKSGIITDGRLQKQSAAPTLGAQGAESMCARAAEIVAGLGPADAVGISTRGQVDTQRGVIIYDPPQVIAGYTGFPIRRRMAALCGLPVAVENDVNCAALAEGAFGAAKGCRDYLCLTFGAGIGGAIVSRGRLWRGANYSAGEFGMMAFGPNATWEEHASASALIAAAQGVLPQIKTGLDAANALNHPGVADAARQWAACAAAGLRSVIHALNPGRVILGGGVMEDPRILALVRDATLPSLAPGFQCAELLPAALGNDAGLIGAGLVASAMAKESSAR